MTMIALFFLPRDGATANWLLFSLVHCVGKLVVVVIGSLRRHIHPSTHHSSSFLPPSFHLPLINRVQTPIATGVLLGCTAMFSQIQLLLFTIFEARR